jgi:arylsulfatase A-like enzyme
MKRSGRREAAGEGGFRVLRSTLRAGGLALLLASVVCAVTPAGAQTAPASSPRVQGRRPNLLLILVDDLGYGDLSSYGARDVRTPHIDALVEGGARLDRFYANSPVCSPTRAALLSGRYPDLIGVPGVVRTDPRDSWGYLSPRARLLPESLRRAGYDTALVGKWHLGLESPNLPLERGFAIFRGFLGDMMDDYYTHLRHGINYMRDGRREVKPAGHATDIFTDWAIEYLSARRRAGKPFFLYLAYNAPHVPVQPPAEWLNRVTRREPSLSPQRARLVAFIEHLDASVGRVVAALKASGQYDNTVIIFTSDNGGQLNAGATSGPLRGGKEEFYEGGIRVPLAFVWPGRIAPGTRPDRIALTMDLLPTFFEAANVPLDREVDGESFLPALLKGEATARERTLFWMRREGGGFYHGRDYFAVRRGPWKLMQNHPYMPYRLFNLDEDPHEDRDVVKEHGKVVEELSRELRRHLQRAGRVPWQKGAEEESEMPRR